MKVLIINGSPAGENSITLQTALFLEKHFSQDSFDVIHAAQKIRSYETDFSGCAEKLKEADLLLFCYPVYTFLAPAQLHQFISLIKENNIDLSGRYAAQITTSKHFYDITAHTWLQQMCADMQLRFIGGLSADMEDLLAEKGQQDALSFWNYVHFAAEKGIVKEIPAVQKKELYAASYCAPLTQKSLRRVVIVADLADDTDGLLLSMIRRFQNRMNANTEVADISTFPFQGGCLGCFRCAASGKCFYTDGFADWLRSTIQTADAVVYAYTIKDHSMGMQFKLFDDRQFCNGHRTVMMGKPVGYLVSGNLSQEENLKVLMHARSQVGGNYPAGIACNETQPDKAIDDLADVLDYALKENLQQPADFYGVGGMKIFRDLIYQMQGMMREDHRFYKRHGFYDFPQKHKGRIMAMYLVGAMMSSQKLQKKAAGKMTEGMIMPYKLIIDKDRVGGSD